MNHKKGMSILVAAGMLVNTLPVEDFKLAMDSFSGVDGSNIEEVAAKLMEAGINEYAGSMAQSAREPMDTREKSAPKRRADAASFMVLLCGGEPDQPLPDHVYATAHTNSTLIERWGFGPPPAWAEKLADKRTVLPWNSEQYIA